MAKKSPNPTDKHRWRPRADAPPHARPVAGEARRRDRLTFQQVQKYEKGANRIRRIPPAAKSPA